MQYIGVVNWVPPPWAGGNFVWVETHENDAIAPRIRGEIKSNQKSEIRIQNSEASSSSSSTITTATVTATTLYWREYQPPLRLSDTTISSTDFFSYWWMRRKFHQLSSLGF
ncbi:hypothetical protein Salat_2293300 [Sesamum alatum]|uniref:Uncharacterized protein n=1 Tax=Sesamum alatum TaxID=300844 RepID=A0AAE2CE76_9LAMI|nr:hypothetical protein Salat_2293300 [Sesamum alatum]